MKSEWCVSVSFSSSIYWGGKRIKHFFYLCIRNPQKMQNHCKTNCLYQRNKSLGSSVTLLFRYSYCLHTVLLQTACQTFATLNQQDNCTPIQNKSSFPKKKKTQSTTTTSPLTCCITTPQETVALKGRINWSFNFSLLLWEGRSQKCYHGENSS